jgi:hypothetical protein
MQGEGSNTPRKQLGFALLFRQCLRISLAVPYPYWHLDVNAGCGWNRVSGCPGSPLVFLSEAALVGKPFNAFFVDSDAPGVEELRHAVGQAFLKCDNSTMAVACLDNRAACERFSEKIAEAEGRPDLAVGSWVCDPNGFHGLPLDGLKMLCRRHPRIDAILSLNVSLFGRVRGCKGNSATPGFDNWPDPEDVLGLQPLKKHWLVRNPSWGGRGERFTIFLGRNTEAGMTRFKDFYPLESEAGQRIVRYLKGTRPDQGTLWQE